MATQHTYSRQYVKPVVGVNLQEAARELGLTRGALLKQLQDLGIFQGKFPRRHFVQYGFFVLDARQHTYIYGIKNNYMVTLITPAGLIFISEQIHALSTETPAAMRHGNTLAT